MTDIRVLAFMGIALPFALMVMAAMSERILGKNPLIPLLASFFIAMGMYLPWNNQTFRQQGTLTVCVIAVAALVIQFLVAVMVFIIMFWIGGDTI